MKKTLTILGLALVASQSFGAVTLIANRSDFVQTDEIRWEDKGPAFTALGGNFNVQTHGTPFTVNVKGSSFMSRRDGGNGWLTGYPNGEPLVFSGDATPMVLTGAKTCNDVGLDIDADSITESYTAFMKARNGLGQDLGTVSIHMAGRTDAGFIGVHSDAGDIHSVELWVTLDSGVANGFAIDHVSYRCCSPVPEPATMSALGLGALALLRRKKNS